MLQAECVFLSLGSTRKQLISRLYPRSQLREKTLWQVGDRKRPYEHAMRFLRKPSNFYANHVNE